MQNNDLKLSVIVLTYNSSETIVKTLESIVDQAIYDIELIFADDGSSDSTVRIIESWMAKNYGVFTKVQLLNSNLNRGICRNVSDACLKASGSWIKLIAGDDYFLPGAFKCYLKVMDNTAADIIVTGGYELIDMADEYLTEKNILSSNHLEILNGVSTELHKNLILSNIIPAPSALFKRAAFTKVQGIDLSFVHLDDWPLWIRMAEMNMTFWATAQPTVAYRVSSESISSRKDATEINKKYLNDLILFYAKYQAPKMMLLDKIDRWLCVLRWKLIANFNLNKYFYILTIAVYIFSPKKWKHLLCRVL